MSFVCLSMLVLCTTSKTTDQRLTVFAAASLKDAFTSISHNFERIHPGTTVTLNFAGSQTLSAQIAHGAPADVFASASKKYLDAVNPVANSVHVFAYNRLVIVVKKGESRVTSPKTLARVSKIVVADESVPAGHYAQEFFHQAAKKFGDPWLQSVNGHIVSRETDVRSVLAKVLLGEADAGIVYVSDAVSAKGRVQQVPIPDDLGIRAEYPAGVMSMSPQRALAQDFVHYLLTPASQHVLVQNGFIGVPGKQGPRK